jgi:hypothetical protein
MPSEPLNTARLCADSLVEQAKALQHLIQAIPGSVSEPKNDTTTVAKPPTKKERLASDFITAHRLTHQLEEFRGGTLNTLISDQITIAIDRDETVSAIMPHISNDPLRDFSALPDKAIIRIVEAYQSHLQKGKKVIEQMSAALEMASKQLEQYEARGMVEPVIVAPPIETAIAAPVETPTALAEQPSPPDLNTLMHELRSLQG